VILAIIIRQALGEVNNFYTN